MEVHGGVDRMREIISAEKELEAGTRRERQYEVEARMESGLAELDGRRAELVNGRGERVKEVYRKGDKKLNKLAKNEEKTTNRILWVVITRIDGSVGDDDLVDVGSLGSYMIDCDDFMIYCVWSFYFYF
jgi:hypothetical protein